MWNLTNRWSSPSFCSLPNTLLLPGSFSPSSLRADWRDGFAMKYDPQRHRRRSLRLKGYDYCLEGAYFVTVCTHGRCGYRNGEGLWNDACAPCRAISPILNWTLSWLCPIIFMQSSLFVGAKHWAEEKVGWSLLPGPMLRPYIQTNAVMWAYDTENPQRIRVSEGPTTMHIPKEG